MLMAALLLAAGVVTELETSAGAARPTFDGGGYNSGDPGSLAPAFTARYGVDVGQLTLSAAFLGVAGSGSKNPLCVSECIESGSFQAFSGLALLRLHSEGTVQLYVEGGGGIGRVIDLSGDHPTGIPGLRGKVGPSFWLGAGGRWFVTRQAAIGLTLAWTTWGKISAPAQVVGSAQVPPKSNLNATAILLLGSFSWSFGKMTPARARPR